MWIALWERDENGNKSQYWESEWEDMWIDCVEVGITKLIPGHQCTCRRIHILYDDDDDDDEIAYFTVHWKTRKLV